MIKVQAPNMALRIIDDAIQAHGAGGVSDDFGLANAYAHQRTLRLADGPDEVHARAIARIEFARHAPNIGNDARMSRGFSSRRQWRRRLIYGTSMNESCRSRPAQGSRSRSRTSSISKPGPHEVLIRTAACGLCHSDLHFIEGSLSARAARGPRPRSGGRGRGGRQRSAHGQARRPCRHLPQRVLRPLRVLRHRPHGAVPGRRHPARGGRRRRG